VRVRAAEPDQEPELDPEPEPEPEGCEPDAEPDRAEPPPDERVPEPGSPKPDPPEPEPAFRPVPAPDEPAPDDEPNQPGPPGQDEPPPPPDRRARGLGVGGGADVDSLLALGGGPCRVGGGGADDRPVPVSADEPRDQPGLADPPEPVWLSSREFGSGGAEREPLLPASGQFRPRRDDARTPSPLPVDPLASLGSVGT
jgi:hypothetical protein